MNFKKRIVFIYIIVLISFFILMVRLSYIKIASREKYFTKALEQWRRVAPIEGRRGNIYDRNGKLIVGNKLAPTVVAIPKQVKNKKEVSIILSEILECNTNNILKHLNKNVSVEIIKPEGRKITIEKAQKIISQKIDGIYVVSDTIRYYPYQNMLAQVLGIVGIDGVGLTGIEAIYNDELKGDSGGVLVYTDAHGNHLENYQNEINLAKIGNDIYLTIDLNLQVILERILFNATYRYNPDEIIGIIANPKTMEIYAMASLPTFDLANYNEYPQELYNRNLAIWSSYEPGSTFKFVTFSAGIEENVFKLDENYYDPGYIMVGGARIKDWKKGGHGSETFLQVIENSCNPGFVTIGQRLGKEKLFKYIKDYGFGEKTNIDLLGEATGIIFKDEKIGPVELATSSFGQGVSVTPIQLVTALSACINGGNLYKPYVVQKIGKVDENPNEIVKTFNPTFVRRVISEKTSSIMRYSLESVVAKGTGRGSFIEGYRVGGKTGVLPF